MSESLRSGLKFVNSHRRLRLFIAIGLVLFISLILSYPSFTNLIANAASSVNTVLINYDHTERTVPTQAKTVGELLTELNITINHGDVVEPALTAGINQDNFRINIYRAVPVVIIDGTHRTYTFSAAPSPRTVAAEAGITVYAEDNLTRGPVTNFAADNAIGEQIVIDRATPVNFMLYGHPSVVRTHAETVGELLAEKKIVLASGDTLTPAAGTPLTSGLSVAVSHQGIEYKTVAEEIPAPVRYIDDSDLAFGTGAVRQAGTPGEQDVTYEITTKDGQEVSRKALQTVVTAQPVERVIARGTAASGSVSGTHSQWMSAAGIASGDQGYADYIIQHESHWHVDSLNSRGCAGLGQACPGNELSAVCPNWQIDPVCQLKLFAGYAQGRYGSWSAAYNFKVAHGWW